MEVKWNRSAIRDLKKIHDFIKVDSAFYGAKVMADILDASQGLAKFPKLGRIVLGTSRPETREIFIYSYRLIYRVHENVVRVLVLVHSRRDFDPAEF